MNKIALFRLGDTEFATNFSEVIELIEPQQCREVNPARAPFIGVATWRSELLPVADVAQLLTGKALGAAPKMWLLLKCEKKSKIALQIEGAAQWRSLGTNEFVPAASCGSELKITNPYAKDVLLGVYCQQGQKPIPVLDIPSLLPSRERNWLNELHHFGLAPQAEVIAEKLGEEWRRLHRFYPAQVQELLLVSAERPSELEESLQQCRKQIALEFPSSLQECAPFLVRHLWSHGQANQGKEITEELLHDFYSTVVMLSGKVVDWKLEELKEAVLQIMER